MATTPIAYPSVFRGTPSVGYPNSTYELRRAQTNSPLEEFLRTFARRDVVSYFEDFITLGSSALTPYWTVAGGGGASQVNFTQNLQVSGAIRLTTGTANGVTASGSMIGPIIYPGTANPGIEVRFKTVTASTAIRMELGFIDAVPATNTAGFNNMDTPTVFMANGVTAGIDTAATANKFNLIAVGTATNQAVKKAVGTTGLAAAGTWQTIRIQLFSRDYYTANAVDARMWHNGQPVANLDVSATAGVGCVNGSVLLAPWIYFEATDASSKSLDVDYVHIWHDRV